MKSFCGTITKQALVKEIQWHQEQDQIIQGTYGKGVGKNWKGCAVGCSIKSINKLEHKRFDTSDHEVYESELGIPEWLAKLEDVIFEGLPVEKAKQWPLRFTQAIPVGVDLDPIKWKFCAFILNENIERVLLLNIANGLQKQVVDAIRGVLNLHETAIKTAAWSAGSAAESAGSAAWSAAESAGSAAQSAAWSAAESAQSAAQSAWSAAWSAAESARSAAQSAAWSAAESAGSAAQSAAWSAAESAGSAAESAGSAAWSAAWSAESAAFERYADKLIELLEAAV